MADRRWKIAKWGDGETFIEGPTTALEDGLEFEAASVEVMPVPDNEVQDQITVKLSRGELSALYDEETSRRERAMDLALGWFDVDEAIWQKLRAALNTPSQTEGEK